MLALVEENSLTDERYGQIQLLELFSVVKISEEYLLV